MINYAPQLPKGQDSNPLQEFPFPLKAKVVYGSENASASSVISVGHNTTTIEVAAVGGPAVIRWITQGDTAASVVSAASGANFDHVVPTNTYRKFVLPIETQGSTFFGSVQGINRANGLYQRVAIKSIGVASVLLTEY